MSVALSRTCVALALALGPGVALAEVQPITFRRSTPASMPRSSNRQGMWWDGKSTGPRSLSR